MIAVVMFIVGGQNIGGGFVCGIVNLWDLFGLCYCFRDRCSSVV